MGRAVSPGASSAKGAISTAMVSSSGGLLTGRRGGIGVGGEWEERLGGSWNCFFDHDLYAVAQAECLGRGADGDVPGAAAGDGISCDPSLHRPRMASGLCAFLLHHGAIPERTLRVDDRTTETGGGGGARAATAGGCLGGDWESRAFFGSVTECLRCFALSRMDRILPPILAKASVQTCDRAVGRDPAAGLDGVAARRADLDESFPRRTGRGGGGEFARASPRLHLCNHSPTPCSRDLIGTCGGTIPALQSRKI